MLSQAMPETQDLRAEFPGAQWPVYRLRLRPQAHATLTLPGGGALVAVCGTAWLPDAQDNVIDPGQAYWTSPRHCDGARFGGQTSRPGRGASMTQKVCRPRVLTQGEMFLTPGPALREEYQLRVAGEGLFELIRR